MFVGPLERREMSVRKFAEAYPEEYEAILLQQRQKRNQTKGGARHFNMNSLLGWFRKMLGRQ